MTDLSSVELHNLATQDAEHFGVPPQLFIDQIQQESGFNPNAVNGNATGIAQFMPGTATGMGVTNTYDASQALYGAAAYDAQLYKQTGSWATTVKDYGTVSASGPANAGQQTVLNDATAADAGDTGLLTQDVSATGGQAPTSDFYSWMQTQGIDPGGNNPDTGQPYANAQDAYAQYTPQQDQKLTYLYQQQTGKSAFGTVGSGGTGNGGLTSGSSSLPGSLGGLNVTGTEGGFPLTENVSGALKVDTANSGGISGLATQIENWSTGILGAVETDIGNGIVRWMLFALGIMIVIAGIVLLKPVRDTIVKGAELAA